MKQPKRTTSVRQKEKVRYPSAVLLQSACRENYRDLLDRSNKIYDKISIALGFCGVVLLVILKSFDYTLFLRAISTSKNDEPFSVFIQMICSGLSCICIIWALIQLLLLIRGKQVEVFDSLPIRDKNIYCKAEDKSAVFLIECYSNAIANLYAAIEEKQKSFDTAITKMAVAILSYALLEIVKGAT